VYACAAREGGYHATHSRCTPQDDALLELNPLTVHRLVLGSVLLAAKLYDDDVYDNKFFSCVGGVSISDLCLIERDLLRRLSMQPHSRLRLHLDHDHLATALHELQVGTFQWLHS
jgi:hypothetical protein